MPLLKCKIHRLTVALEGGCALSMLTVEKTDYFAQQRKVARHEAPKRFVLLAIKQPEKRLDPLLPIISESSTAAEDSPVAEMAIHAATFPDTAQDALATLLDPMGPWHLESDLTVPDCAAKIRFTTKHEQTNIAISHWLKVTIRVERGDDVAVDAKGKRKQFDIIM
jgi:hypothetical protein